MLPGFAQCTVTTLARLRAHVREEALVAPQEAPAQRRGDGKRHSPGGAAASCDSTFSRTHFGSHHSFGST